MNDDIKRVIEGQVTMGIVGTAAWGPIHPLRTIETPPMTFGERVLALVGVAFEKFGRPFHDFADWFEDQGYGMRQRASRRVNAITAEEWRKTFVGGETLTRTRPGGIYIYLKVDDGSGEPFTGNAVTDER